MTSRYVKPTLALLFVLGVGLAFAVAPAATAQLVLDWRVIGTGDAGGSCATAFFPGCTADSDGDAIGTHIGNSTWSVRLRTGTTGKVPIDNSSGGQCFVANGSGKIIEANGDVIGFSTVGWLCEEAQPRSPYHYNGTYRIDRGSGRFADAVGGGNLALTNAPQTKAAKFGESFIKIDGTINF
jgi:hypothetical protein